MVRGGGKLIGQVSGEDWNVGFPGRLPRGVFLRLCLTSFLLTCIHKLGRERIPVSLLEGIDGKRRKNILICKPSESA